MIIEASAVAEYVQLIGKRRLDLSRFQVVADLRETNPSEFHSRENQELNQ